MARPLTKIYSRWSLPWRHRSGSACFAWSFGPEQTTEMPTAPCLPEMTSSQAAREPLAWDSEGWEDVGWTAAKSVGILFGRRISVVRFLSLHETMWWAECR